MKKFTFTLLLASVCYFAQAQFTLNHWDYTLQPGDTFKLVANWGTPTLPTTGANQVWDFSSITFDLTNPTNILYNPLNSSYQMDFPNANIQRIFYQQEVIGYTTSQMVYASDARGLHIEGSIEEPKSFDLYNTGGSGQPGDSLIMAGGPSPFSAPLPWVSTPLNYGDKDSVIAVRSTYLELKAPSVGLTMDVERRRIKKHSYEVTGWGDLILTNSITMQPDTFEVLLQRIVTMTRDSFFNVATGMPLTPTELGLLSPSISQGYISNYWANDDFYTPGPKFPALTIEYQDIDNPNDPAVWYITGDLFDASYNVSTKEPVFVQTPHRVYPNPVTNHQFQLEIEKANSENWKLQVFALNGVKLYEQDITSNTTAVRLNERITMGTYIYSVVDEAGQIRANGKLNIVD